LYFLLGNKKKERRRKVRDSMMHIMAGEVMMNAIFQVFLRPILFVNTFEQVNIPPSRTVEIAVPEASSTKEVYDMIAVAICLPVTCFAVIGHQVNASLDSQVKLIINHRRLCNYQHQRVFVLLLVSFTIYCPQHRSPYYFSLIIIFVIVIAIIIFVILIIVIVVIIINITNPF
jgi:hypothetical protein